MTAATPSRHWAASLIGKPWSPEFTCLHLVQQVVRLRLGTELPDVAHAHESGWRPVDGPPQADDVVLMLGLRGRHIGIMIAVDDKLLLLHNDGSFTPRGPRGGVVAQPLADAARDGYHNMEAWRYSP